MAITLVAKQTVTFAGALAAPSAISLTSGWNTTYGSATYAPVQDDLVIVSYGVGGTTDRAMAVVTSGYTTEAELYANGTGQDANLSVSWKFMSSSPDTSVSLPSTGSLNNAGSVIIEVYSGVDTTTPIDVTTVTATGLGTARPNPGAITPSTAGTVIVAIGHGAAATGAAYTQSGSQLSNFLSASSTDTVCSMIGSGSAAWTSGAFDPVAWTGGVQAASNSWVAVSLALRPAGGGGGNTYNDTLSAGITSAASQAIVGTFLPTRSEAATAAASIAAGLSSSRTLTSGITAAATPAAGLSSSRTLTSSVTASASPTAGLTMPVALANGITAGASAGAALSAVTALTAALTTAATLLLVLSAVVSLTESTTAGDDATGTVPETDGSLASYDFVAGTGHIGGVAKTLDEMFEENSNFGSHDPDTIVEGVGYTAPASDADTITTTAELFAAIFPAFTCVLEYETAGAGSPLVTLICADGANFTEYWQWRAWNGVGEKINDGNGVTSSNVTAPSIGAHSVAVTMSPDLLSFANDGGTEVAAVGDPQDNDLADGLCLTITANSATVTVTKISFFAVAAPPSPLTETITLAATATALLAMLGAVTNSITAAATASPVLTAVTTVTNSLTLAATPVPGLTIPVSLSGAVTTTASQTASQGFAASLTETATLTETRSGGLAFAATLSAAVTPAASQAIAVTFAPSLSATITGAASGPMTASMVAGVSEATSPAASPSPSLAMAVTGSASVTPATSIAAGNLIPASLANSLTPAASQSVVATFAPALNAALVTSDALYNPFSLSGALSESFSPFDTYSAIILDSNGWHHADPLSPNWSGAEGASGIWTKVTHGPASWSPDERNTTTWTFTPRPNGNWQ